MTLAAIWAVVRPILFFAVPVPVALILLAWAWVHFDKASAVRQAVDTAVTRLVDGAELEAARAEIAALQAINARQNADARADAEALRKFADLLTAAETDNESLSDAIALIESQPVDAACRVDQRVLDRLR